MTQPPFAFETVDEALFWAADECIKNGEVVAPRGLATRELLGVNLCLTNPRARMPTFPRRRWSLPLAIGELCWHFRASDDVSALTYYAPRWGQYSDDGYHVPGSCYGRIALTSDHSSSQWYLAKELLKTDPSTRRAILIFDTPRNSDMWTRDKSCLTSMQFLSRSGRLDAIVTMRSNDVYIGLPYDIFLFTMMQEIMAIETGLNLGKYIHFVSSFHIYEGDVSKALNAYSEPGHLESPMPPMQNLEELEILIDAEERIRAGKLCPLPKLGSYWNGLLQALVDFREQRELSIA